MQVVSCGVITWNLVVFALNVTQGVPGWWLSEFIAGGLFFITFGVVTKFIVQGACHRGIFAWSTISTTDACGRIVGCEMLCFLSGLLWFVNAVFRLGWK